MVNILLLTVVINLTAFSAVCVSFQFIEFEEVLRVIANDDILNQCYKPLTHPCNLFNLNFINLYLFSFICTSSVVT